MILNPHQFCFLLVGTLGMEPQAKECQVQPVRNFSGYQLANITQKSPSVWFGLEIFNNQTHPAVRASRDVCVWIRSWGLGGKLLKKGQELRKA